jgi:hypothetical protein
MGRAEPFGPFRPDVDPVERVAQLRTLRTLVHVHSHDGIEPAVEDVLRQAEQDAFVLETALQAFDLLPALTRRRILATFAYIHKPLYASARKATEERNARC